MYYKLTYTEPKTDTTIVEELNCKKQIAHDRAFVILENHERKGEVIIERRHSEWYGDFEKWLTCEFVEGSDTKA